MYVLRAEVEQYLGIQVYKLGPLKRLANPARLKYAESGGDFYVLVYGV